jgi:DNA-binding XRE family transcriptional regulator
MGRLIVAALAAADLLGPMASGAYVMAHHELEERAMAKMRVVIYLRGEDDGELDDAEKRCSEHAERFGWQVLDVTRHKTGTMGDLSQLVLRVSKLRAQIIVTDTLDMLSLDAAVRDGFMEAIERKQCIVHPVNTPPRPTVAASGGDVGGREMDRPWPAHRWTTVIDGERLREMRLERGLSQEQLAHLARISLSTMARLESQERSPCRSWTLGRLAAALDETPDSMTPGPAVAAARR